MGDDFRYIDWGLYGRTDKLYIKLFKEEEDLLTYIFVDASASMGFPAGDRKFTAAVSGMAPLLLLDEIAAHFDPTRRDALFDALKNLSGQIWLSGADPAIFRAIKDRARLLTVSPGMVNPSLAG